MTIVEQEDVNSGWPDKVTTQDVYDSTSSSVVKSRDVYRGDFVQNWLYQGFNYQLPASAGHAYEFRTYWFDKAYIRQDLAFARRL